MPVEHKPSELSSSTDIRMNDHHIIDRRMKMYSAAALAAGVGMLALAQAAEAEVVITRKQIPIPVSSYFGTQHLVPISINNNGVVDFSFSLYSFAYHARTMNLRAFTVQSGNDLVEGANGYASALARGAKIGPSARFSSRGDAEIERSNLCCFTNSSRPFSQQLTGDWGGDPKNHYLGVRFLIDGETHYGWIRFSVSSGDDAPIAATITGYAYESIANQRILAGLPETTARQVGKAGGPSLGMLAGGAEAVPTWRRQPVPPAEASPVH
jgi:hypothetical protein